MDGRKMRNEPIARMRNPNTKIIRSSTSEQSRLNRIDGSDGLNMSLSHALDKLLSLTPRAHPPWVTRHDGNCNKKWKKPYLFDPSHRQESRHWAYYFETERIVARVPHRSRTMFPLPEAILMGRRRKFVLCTHLHNNLRMKISANSDSFIRT